MKEVRSGFPHSESVHAVSCSPLQHFFNEDIHDGNLLLRFYRDK